MSHENIGANRRIVYRMPALASDVLRSREFNDFFELYRGAPFSIETRDGWTWSSSTARPPVFTVTFKNRATLGEVVSSTSDNALIRTFFNGDLDFEGDNSTLFALTEYVLAQSSGLSHGMIYTLTHVTREIFKRFRPAPAGFAMQQSWKSESSLSDLPVDLLQHWLGPSLEQSCACFHASGESFEAAQRNGLDRVCGVLKLQDSDRLLDIRCGWGSLMLHAAARRKLHVQGTTLSQQQAAVTSEFIRRSGLDRQCAVEHRNIKTSPYPPETFDKITDINVLEPAASSQIPGYFECIHRILTPGGQLLLQRMTLSPEATLHKNSAHLQSMLFMPDVAPLSTELQAAEAAGLDVLSVENLCEDYRKTLRLWIKQLQYDPRQGITAEQYRSYRTWLLYLVEAATTLDAGDVQFYQILLRRRSRARVNQTRSRLPERRTPKTPPHAPNAPCAVSNLNTQRSVRLAL